MQKFTLTLDIPSLKGLVPYCDWIKNPPDTPDLTKETRQSHLGPILLSFFWWGFEYGSLLCMGISGFQTRGLH